MAHQKFLKVINTIDKFLDWASLAKSIGIHRNTIYTYKSGEGKRPLIELIIMNASIKEFRVFVQEVNNALEELDKILCEP